MFCKKIKGFCKRGEINHKTRRGFYHYKRELSKFTENFYKTSQLFYVTHSVIDNTDKEIKKTS